MRVLTTVLAVGVAVLAPAGATAGVAAHPPPTPTHGLNASTHFSLWTGDIDDGSPPGFGAGGVAGAQRARIAAATDLPLAGPPAAVERWNRRDIREFPQTGVDASVAPPHATRRDGQFVRDAHATVFAVQPSTRLGLSGRRQPLYVAPAGALLGAVDYRVTLPADDDRGAERTSWSLAGHRVAETRLLVDGATETVGGGSHTPHLSYRFSDASARPRELVLAADIAVTVTRTERTRRRDCWPTVNGTRCEWDWTTERSQVTETVTVSDSIGVTPYDIDVSGAVATLPDGDTRLLVAGNLPWRAVRLPGGRVRSAWRFYAARDTGWDRLVRTTAAGRTTRHSPVHPLWVTAYPSAAGVTASPRDAVRIAAATGPAVPPGKLPPTVRLDAAERPSAGSRVIDVRVDRRGTVAGPVSVRGLVRTTGPQRDPATFSRVQVNRSRLRITVLQSTARTVTVRVTLRDAATGEPISTRDREGHVVLAGERGNTSQAGTLVRTIERPAGAVSARYQPGRWWHDGPAYTRSGDVATVSGTLPGVVETLFRLGVPVGTFLLAGFLIDRLTGWQLWPPWGRDAP